MASSTADQQLAEEQVLVGRGPEHALEHVLAEQPAPGVRSSRPLHEVVAVGEGPLPHRRAGRRPGRTARRAGGAPRPAASPGRRPAGRPRTGGRGSRGRRRRRTGRRGAPSTGSGSASAGRSTRKAKRASGSSRAATTCTPAPTSARPCGPPAPTTWPGARAAPRPPARASPSSGAPPRASEECLVMPASSDAPLGGPLRAARPRKAIGMRQSGWRSPSTSTMPPGSASSTRPCDRLPLPPVAQQVDVDGGVGGQAGDAQVGPGRCSFAAAEHVARSSPSSSTTQAPARKRTRAARVTSTWRQRASATSAWPPSTAHTSAGAVPLARGRRRTSASNSRSLPQRVGQRARRSGQEAGQPPGGSLEGGGGHAPMVAEGGDSYNRVVTNRAARRDWPQRLSSSRAREFMQ